MNLKILCPEFSFFCKKDKICISLMEICDGNKDCFSNEDEEICIEPLYFQCHSGNQTIPNQYFCDFKVDCTDLSDEIYCS